MKLARRQAPERRPLRSVLMSTEWDMPCSMGTPGGEYVHVFWRVTNETMECVCVYIYICFNRINHPEVDGIWDFQAHSHFGEVETSTF